MAALALTLMLASVPLAALPAGAASDTTDTHDDHGLPFAPVGNEPIPLEDAFPAEGEVDLNALGGWYRQQIRETGGFDVPLLDDEDSGASHVTYTGSLLYPMPAGDLDGDGTDDLLVYELDYDTFQILTHGVKSDGTTLWSSNASAYGSEDLIPVTGGDFDGDGTFDVLTLRIFDVTGDGASQCASALLAAGCVLAGAGILDIEFEVLRGQDGTTLWRQTHQVTVGDVDAFAFASGLVAVALVEAGAHAIEGLPGIPTAGADGSGGIDLSIPDHDILFAHQYGFAFGVGASGLSLVATTLVLTEVQLQDGATGAVVGRSTPFPTHDLPTTDIVGDVDGDGDVDAGLIGHSVGAAAYACGAVLLGTCGFVPEQGGLLVTTQDLHGDGVIGANVVPADRAAPTTIHFVDDLDGDGIRDALTVSHPTLIMDPVLHAHSLGDATTLWNTEFPGFRALHTEDLDGDGTPEILGAAGEWGDLEVGVLDGSTGQDLGYSALDLLDHAFDVRVRGIDDVDGDGVRDIGVAALGHGPDDDEQLMAVLTDRGASVAWATTAGHTHDLPQIGSDGFTYTTFEHFGWFSGEVTIHHMATNDGTLQWTRTGGGEFFAFSPVTAGDLDADGADDTMAVYWTEEEVATNGTYTITALANIEAIGADGSQLWSYGDDIPAYVPPEPRAQNDAGSGGDAGNSRSSATNVSAGTHDGELYPSEGDDDDWYRVDAADGSTITAQLAMNHQSDFDLRLYQGHEFLDSSSNGGSETDTVSGTAIGDEPFYVVVDAFSGEGGYNLTITLDGNDPGPDPDPVDPRIESFNASGTIGCAVAAGPFQTKDLCRDSGNTFDFPADIGLTGLHVEVVWTQDATAPSEELQVNAQMPVGLSSATGGSPLVADWTFDREDGLDQVRIHVAQARDSGLIVGQDFDLCLTTLYGGATLPADHSCMAEA